MSNHVTIADVANHLGVSKSTVSHALSGKRRISTEVRRQVMEAVEELGYRPRDLYETIRDTLLWLRRKKAPAC